ncbi:hypothetical protein AN963_01460 [Brevibacillus choshinensis]|uniref:HD domain-containing protein n=1 Tax=Brevibacillus choshinensis TaxID=54911 RepID=A0ABR5NAC1_BRECH|nr:hypothetical protein [Brevibacillus choshinensis]KQL48505.1 hypothetical protein AN963_01460 [Brevibacillus choshinensis]
MVATQDQSQKLWMLAKRMEPHLIRNHANMEKLLKMLILHDVACTSAEQGTSMGQKWATKPGLRIETISNHDVQAIWNEFERNESYEAKIAHAIIHLINQVEF